MKLSSVFLIIFMLIGINACGIIDSDKVFQVTTVTSSFKPLKKKFEKASDELMALQQEKNIFSDEELYTLIQGQESIDYVLNRLSAIEASPDSWVTISELEFLWNRVVDGYNSMRKVIVDKWDELPTTMKLNLVALDEQAKNYSNAMEPLLHSDDTKDVDKIFTVFKSVISLAIKLMGAL